MKNTLPSKNLPFVATGIPTPLCKPKTHATKNLKGLLALVLMVLGMQMGWGQIAAWDFQAVVSASPPATFSATTFNSNLVSTSGANNITRGAGAVSSGANYSFRTAGFQNQTISTSSTAYFQVTLQAATGYKTSLSTIDAKFGGTTTFYAGAGVKSQFAYSIDGTNFTLIGSPVQSTLLTMTQINLSGISALQNVAAGTTITLRYYASGQTTTGGWGFLSASVAGTNGLAIGGTVVTATTAATVTNTTPATNIATTSATLAGNVTATGGANISANGSVYSLTATNAAPQISGTGVTQLATTSPSTSTGVFSNNSIVTLSVNTQYSFNAYATNSVGTSYGTVSTFYTLANVPSAPTVSNATANSMTIALNENGNPATTQYAIQEAGGLYVQNNGTLGTFALWKTAGLWGTITVSGLSANTNYTFKVKAKNGENVETAFSGTTSLSTLAGSSPVANITGPVAEESLNTFGLQLTLTNDTFSATPISTNFTLNNAPSGVTIGSVTYNSSSSVTLNLVYNGDFDANVTTFSVTIASTVLTSAAALTTNAITLTALTESLSVGTVTGFGNQTVNTTSAEKSFTVSGTVRSTVSLVPPTGYEISTGTGGSFVATNPIDLTPTGTSLSSTTIYVRFKPTDVVSYSGNITGSATAVSTATVALTGTGIAPANPSVFSATTASNSQINLAATANGNSNNIVVVFNATGTFASPTNGVTAGVQGDAFAGGTIWFNGAAGSITNHTGLSAATTYYYKAFSYDSLNFYSAGATATATTVKAEPSAQATSLAFSTITTSSFTTAFSAAAGTPDGYLVIRSANSTLSANPVDGTAYTTSSTVGGGSVVSVGSTITGIANTSLSSGTTYYTFVFAYNNSGTTIDYLTTNPLTASIITLCAAPAPLASNVTAISFDISWTAITGAASYQLDVTTDAGFTAFVSGYNSLSVAGTSQALSGLLSNTPYYFRVRAVNASGNSAYGTGSQTTSVLTTPVATAATSVGSTSFTANWGAVTGAASGYLLDVSTSATFGSTIISENFSGFTTNNGSTDRFSTLDTYLQTTGWTGAVIYEMVGYTKMGSGSSRGIITTPTLNLSVNGGISTLTFDLSKYGSDATSVQVFHAADGVNFVQVGSDITAPTSMTTQTISITGGTSSSKIRIQAKNAANYRFYLDNFLISYSTILPSYNNLSVNGTSQAVTGLTSGTTYYYRVRATDGTASANSNVITVTTKSTPTVTPTISTYTYTGAPQGPSVATNTGTGTTYTFSYEGVTPTTYAASATAPTNAGSYTVTATVAADGDYVAASSLATPFSISKATFAITANNQTKCAGITLSFVGTEFTSGTLLGSDAVTSVSLTSTGAGSAAIGGTYSIVPSAATGTGLSNYTITYTNGSLTVNQSTITLGYIDDVLPTDTSFNIPYTATTGSPNKYSLATAASGGNSIAMPNFAPISNANLVSSPITVIIPASAAAEYGFNLTVTNTTTGCSQVFPFQFHVTNVVAGTIAGDQSICSGATPSAITSSQAGSSSDGDPITYTWEQSTTSLSSGYSAISGATSEGYVPGALTQTTYYKRVTHYAGTNPDVTSDTDPVTITVNPTLTASVSIASNDTDNVICFGTNVTFTATPTNGGASPSYQWKVNGSNVGTDSATYTTSALANNDVVSVVLTSNATPCLAGSTATSNSITIVLQNKWLVTASSLWSDSSNWTCGVPSSTDNILIDTGSPQLDTNFTIAGSLTISGSGTLTINPTSVITISGTADFGGRPVTIKSDATGTGTIGQVTGTLTGATNVTVERYIPNKRSWRALTAPVSTATSINANWQEGGTNNGINGFDIWSPTPGSGITTGGSSNSLLQYDSVNNSWIGIAATDGASSMMNGDKNKPFMAFVTGPYGSGNITNNLAAATTIRATGTILTGTKTYASASGQYSFIGNPYASPLNLTTMLASNTSFGGNIWVWDANVAGVYSVGTYNLFDNGTYSNISSNPNISGAQIQSGQAFFVKQSSGNSVDFSIQEAHKGAIFSNAVFRDAAPAQLLRVGLYKQTNNEWSGRDGAMAVFLSDAEANQTTNKISNGSENVAFTKNSELFASEHHLPLVASDVLNVRVWNTTASANYKLKINTEQFTTTNLDATLEDLFTNSRTPIALDGTAIEYPFAVTTDAASTGNRFRIVFQNAALGMNNPKANGITILPNPITGDTFQVNLGTLEMGMYTYSICNALGQEVETGSINNVTQNTNYSVKFKSNTAAGLYIMKVIGTVNAVFTAKLIKK